MSDACINKSLPAYKMLKTRYGEFIADALVTYVTKEKGMDPKKGFYIPTTGESRDFLKKFNENKLQSIRRGLKANPYLTTEGIADYLQGIIRKADGAYFIVKGFEYGPISKAAAVKEIFEPHLQLMETIAKEYPDIFKLVPTKQKQTIVVQITPRTQPARQVPVQQTLFQQEAADGTPIDRLNQILKTKLAEAGIKVEFVDSLSAIYGQDVAGLYDAVKKLVQIANNKAGRDTLPEEAAHALIEALDPSNPLLTKLMNDVVYTTVYEQVKQEYADLYGANEEMYRKEALGKLVAQAWVKQYEDSPSLLKTIELFINKILSLFKKVDINGLQEQINSDIVELADIILNTGTAKKTPASVKQKQVVAEQPKNVTSTISSTIFELEPSITEEKLQAIHANYVNLMNRRREGKSIPYDSFRKLLSQYQVYNYKDTYIFGQYDPNTATFITRVNSSPSSKELLAEAIPNLVKKGVDFISFVPKDYADKLVRSGYTSSTNSYTYDFKGEVMEKFAVASKPSIFKKLFNKTAEEVTANEIEEYNDKIELKYQPVEIKAELIEKAGSELSAVLETYLTQFGIAVKDIEEIKDKLGIDEVGFADMLSKIAYIKDKKDLPPVAGEFIAYMMQYNSLIVDIIKDLSQTTQYKQLDKSQYFKVIGELIAKDLQNKLEGNYNKSLVDKIKELISRFFSLFKTIPIDRINTNIGIISNNILQQNKKLITASLYKPGAFGKATQQVSIEKALQTDKFGASIIYKLAKQGFILTGSTALSEQGTILRPDENPLHDIDWVSPFNRKETIDKFFESYPDAIKVRDIYGDGYVTDSFLIAPDGYSISNYQSNDFNGKIIISAYDVIDRNGNVVGTYRLQKQAESNQSEEVVTGVEGKVIDFFSYEDYSSKNKNKPFSYQSKEGTIIQLAHWKDIFKAKLDFARYKDIWDYNRFIPTENIVDINKVTDTTQTQTIKPGIQELFESNPELANAVYEALGFKNKSKERNNAFIETINNIETSKVGEKVSLHKIFPHISDAFVTKTKDNKYYVEHTEDLFTKEEFENYLLDRFKPTEKETDVRYIGITQQQKQQAQQLYSQYLDSIFPDSKVKDIVYHFSNTKIDKPDKEKFSLSANINRRKGFFGINKNVNPGNNFANVEGTIPHAMLFDMKNPDSGDFSVIPPVTAKDETKDSAIIKQRGGINYYAVFEPEQIHILGTKQDIEGFKEFVKQAPSPIAGSIYYQIKPFTKSVKDILNNKLRALTVLVDKYKKQKSEKAKEYTEELRQKIDSIRSANTELGFANVLDQASKDLDKIALALRQGKYDSLESVEKAIDFVNVWEGLDMFYDEGESPLRKVAMLVEGRRRELSYILKTLHADFVSALVRETTEDAFTVDQVYEGPEDVSGYMRYLGNLASSKDPLLATVNKIYMRDVYDKTREMSNDFVAELQQKAEGITDFSFIVQKYENGKNTKNFVTKYKPEYYEALMDAVSQKPDETYEDFVLRRRQWFKENKNYDDTPIQKWEDPRYAAIQADPKKREFYEFFTSKMEEVRSWIPQSYGKANNLPLFTQAFLDDINRQGLTKAIRGLGTRFADSIRYNEAAAKKLDASGDVVNSLAFYGYMEQDPSKISLDIPTILQNFYHMGLMYKHKNDVKTKIDAIVDTVRERTILEYDADGKLVEKVEGAKSNAYAQLLDWYEGIFLERFYKGSGRLKVPYPSLKKNEEGKWEFNPNALEVDTQKLAARVRGFTAIKNLALNLFSAANNITFGNLANFLEASGGQFYSKTAYREAAAEYFKSIPQRGLKSIKNAFQRKPEKITSLVDGAIHYWDFLQDQTEAEAITKGLLSKIIDFGFSLQQGGEHQIQSTVAIAILKTEKVLNKDGTEFQLNGKSVSVYDAYEIKDGKYVLKPEFKNTKLTDRNYISDLKNKIRGVNQYIHGRYNIEDAAAAQRTLLGASVLQHRKWMPSGIEARFREEYFDYRLGRKMKGRYRSYSELPKLITQFKFNYAAWYKSMSPVDQANMRKNFTELATAVTLIALKMLLDSMKDDDDDLKNNKAFNFAYYQLDRLQSEVYFYSVGLFTGDALAIIKDPAASLTTITNLGEIATDLSTYAFETEEERIIDRGPFKGETKVYRDIAKLTPLVKEYYRFLNLEDQVTFYRSN